MLIYAKNAGWTPINTAGFKRYFNPMDFAVTHGTWQLSKNDPDPGRLFVRKTGRIITNVKAMVKYFAYVVVKLN